MDRCCYVGGRRVRDGGVQLFHESHVEHLHVDAEQQPTTDSKPEPEHNSRKRKGCRSLGRWFQLYVFCESLRNKQLDSDDYRRRRKRVQRLLDAGIQSLWFGGLG